MLKQVNFRVLSYLKSLHHETNFIIRRAVQGLNYNHWIRGVLISMACLNPLCKRLLTGLFLFLQCFSYAKALAPTNHYTLANGLKVVIQEDHRAPMVEMQIIYLVGGIDEPVGLTGISHALEHMMFKGPEGSASGDYDKIINDLGITGNAFTTHDDTVFFCSMVNNRLPVMLALEAERMNHLKVQEKDFASEHQVILEEWRSTSIDAPEGFGYERFMAQAHVNSPYRQPVIGWPDDVKSLTAKNIQDWHDQWYQPNNATLIIVGDVKTREVKDLVDKYFGSIPSKTLPARVKNQELDNLGERKQTLTHPQTTTPSFMMGFNVPALKPDDKDWEPYALRILAGVLDEGYSARIESELIRKQEVALSLGAGYSPLNRLDTLFLFSGTPNQNKGISSEEVTKAIWTLIDQIKNTPPSQEEMERIHSQIVAREVFSSDHLIARSFRLGRPAALGFSNNWLQSYPGKLKSITPKQVQQVAQKYLVPERLTVGYLNPPKNEKGE